MASNVDQYVHTLLAIPTDQLAKDGRECCICFTEFGKRDSNRQVEYATALSRGACGHVFGHLCLAKWLKKDGRCPLCRFVVFRPDQIVMNRYDNDDFPAGMDFAETAEGRAVRGRVYNFQDGFSDYSTDEDEFQLATEINERFRQEATPIDDRTRRATLNEVNEVGVTQLRSVSIPVLEPLFILLSQLWKSEPTVPVSLVEPPRQTGGTTTPP